MKRLREYISTFAMVCIDKHPVCTLQWNDDDDGIKREKEAFLIIKNNLHIHNTTHSINKKKKKKLSVVYAMLEMCVCITFMSMWMHLFALQKIHTYTLLTVLTITISEGLNTANSENNFRIRCEPRHRQTKIIMYSHREKVFFFFTIWKMHLSLYENERTSANEITSIQENWNGKVFELLNYFLL